MLSHLYIENIAIIDRAQIDFSDGLNVLSGETGAGKSIIIDSINVVTGDRAARDMVRTGEKRGIVEACFSDLSGECLDSLARLGYRPDEDGNFILSREITADGKSSARIDGRPVSSRTLRDISKLLININGQHNSQMLLLEENHILFLDAFAHIDREKTDYASCFAEVRELECRLKKLKDGALELAQKLDYTKFKITEIEEAKIKPGEYDELSAHVKVLANAEKITETLGGAYELLYGGDHSAFECVNRAAQQLSAAMKYHDGAAALHERVESLSIEISDIAETLNGMFAGVEYDEREINRIEDRLQKLSRLMKKYGSEEDMLRLLSELKAEVEQTENFEEEQSRLEAEFSKAKAELFRLGGELYKKRREAALAVQRSVAEELAFLNMEGCIFKVEFQRLDEPAQTGLHSVRFLISANRGEEPRPLSKTASGGELSRIMLAIKNVMLSGDVCGCLIFDEVDAGVSGRASGKIGKKLKELSLQRQVVCVTHSAQIASYADAHYLVEKTSEKGRTVTAVRMLDIDGRIAEIARITGGETSSAASLNNARDLLKQAGILN